MSDYLPTKDADLLAWTANFSALLTATPTAYGQTTGVATQYATLQTAFATALAASTNPATRGGAATLAKRQARANLVHYTRQVAMAIQGVLTVTDAQRYDLGLTIRKTEPTPVPVPSAVPLIQVKSVSGLTARIRVIDPANPTRRGKPPGVAGISVFSHVGLAAPASLSDWKFEGSTGVTTVDVVFPDTVAAGAKVWLTCFYFNPRKQSGAACDPVSTNLPGGGVSSMAA